MLVLLVLIEENVKGTTSECSLACDVFLLDYYTTTRHRQYYFAHDLFSTYFEMRTFCTSIICKVILLNKLI